MKKIKEMLSKAEKENRTSLTLSESLEFIKFYGIEVATYTQAETVADAVEFSENIGYPVALKIVSNSISHKTDVGGVFLNLNSKKEVTEAYRSIKKKFGKAMESVIVQKMVDGGAEVIVGGKKDPQFGQTVIFGTGGIYAEAFDDAAVRVTPLTKADAKEMIKETRISRILEGFREKKYDVKSVEDVILKVSKLMDENPEIAELDINPLIVRENSRGSVSVDARIILG